MFLNTQMSHILNIVPIGMIKMHFFYNHHLLLNVLREAINSYITKEEYTLAICLMNFTLRHNEIIVIWSVKSM